MNFCNRILRQVLNAMTSMARMVVIHVVARRNHSRTGGVDVLGNPAQVPIPRAGRWSVGRYEGRGIIMESRSIGRGRTSRQLCRAMFPVKILAT
jgi:hypothetical protein